MAIKTATSKPAKKTVMSFMVFILLGWLTIMSWVSSLWYFSGFDRALYAITDLFQKQTQAITEFDDMKIANILRSWLNNMSTQELSNKVVHASSLIKDRLNKVLPAETHELDNTAEDFIHIAKQVWILFRLASQIIFTKLIILISAIPLFLLATTAGLVDGLNQRSIRTASLGRESSYVFHQLNRYFKQGFFLLLGLWLALPVSITPAFVFVPVSLLLSMMVSVTASRFKKYL